MLGAPVGYEQFTKTKLEEKLKQVEDITGALPLLQNPQIEFLLLTSCLGLRKFMFFLRCTPTFTFDDLLSRFDSITREGLSRILGHPLTDLQWRQAKLPISMSGVGLQGAEDMAAVAFATSYISSHSLIKDLLYTNDEDIEASLPQPLLDQLSEKLGEDTSVESLFGITQNMATLKVNQLHQRLLLQDITMEAGQREAARL